MASNGSDPIPHLDHVVPNKYLSITPNELRVASWKLAGKIADKLDEFRPDWMVVLWRGGAAIGMYVQEYLKRQAGVITDHVTIRTSSYVGVGSQNTEVRVHSVSYIVKHANTDSQLLIVDDIFDSGRTLQAFLDKLRRKMGDRVPKRIRIATLYWKPENNKTTLKPDYYEFEVPGKTWIVFPHEISDFAEDAELANAIGQETVDLINGCKIVHN